MHYQELSLKDLSEAIHISITSISKWRSGKKNISKPSLKALADALNVPPALLVMESEMVGIIRCKECRYYHDGACYGTIIPSPQPDEMQFFSFAKRKC